jgi:hypothetical protein
VLLTGSWRGQYWAADEFKSDALLRGIALDQI